MFGKAGPLAAVLLTSLVLHAESTPTPLVTGQVNEKSRVTLHATISPRVRGMFDRGAAAENLPAGRMLVMLNRPADRQTALDQYLEDLHTPGSASFHHWLTPEQFGNLFGASDPDIQVLSQWLEGHGLQVTRVAHGRQFLEFTGTLGQVNVAFRTAIHEYADGDPAVTRYANATELQIPAALSPLIRGLVPLNNFTARGCTPKP